MRSPNIIWAVPLGITDKIFFIVAASINGRAYLKMGKIVCLNKSSIIFFGIKMGVLCPVIAVPTSI